MRLPTLAGQLERRLLVNYRVDPQVLAPLLPPPFRPQLVNGFAVAGICLIRLGSMRPKGTPGWLGLRSENAAHRVAVEWDDPSGVRSGVYIPRRDSDSLVNVAVGGRLFPGEHHRARFAVTESSTEIRVAVTPLDRGGSEHGAGEDGADVDVTVRIAEQLTGSTLFADTAAASSFFELGSVGYSATKDPTRFEGLELRSSAWRVEPGVAVHTRSSFFDDETRFPPGSATLDCALVMRHVPVTWTPLTPVRAPLVNSALDNSASNGSAAGHPG